MKWVTFRARIRISGMDLGLMDHTPKPNRYALRYWSEFLSVNDGIVGRYRPVDCITDRLIKFDLYCLIMYIFETHSLAYPGKSQKDFSTVLQFICLTLVQPNTCTAKVSSPVEQFFLGVSAEHSRIRKV